MGTGVQTPGSEAAESWKSRLLEELVRKKEEVAGGCCSLFLRRAETGGPGPWVLRKWPAWVPKEEPQA